MWGLTVESGRDLWWNFVVYSVGSSCCLRYVGRVDGNERRCVVLDMQCRCTCLSMMSHRFFGRYCSIIEPQDLMEVQLSLSLGFRLET